MLWKKAPEKGSALSKIWQMGTAGFEPAINSGLVSRNPRLPS